MILKNRYDILLGKPGRNVNLFEPEMFIVLGGRGAGKTFYLFGDMANVLHPPFPRVAFCCPTLHEKNNTSRLFDNMYGYTGNVISFVDSHSDLRGRSFDYFYWDDAYRTPTNMISPILATLARVTKKIMASSITIADSTFDFSLWKTITLQPRFVEK